MIQHPEFQITKKILIQQSKTLEAKQSYIFKLKPKKRIHHTTQTAIIYQKIKINSLKRITRHTKRVIREGIPRERAREEAGIRVSFRSGERASSSDRRI